MTRRSFVLSSTGAALATAQPLQKVTLNFPTRSGASWPMFLAKEGGYLQKYGMDANLVFGVHPAGIAMVVAGEAQMTNYSLETAMQATPRDGSLVVIESWLNKAVFALMAQKDFARVEDLKGKRIAVSQIGDAPNNYTIALLRDYGLNSRDVEWIPVGTDVNGRAAALESRRVEATLLTAPQYFKLEEAGYRNLANLADHDDIFAATTCLMKKSVVASDPTLPERLIKAHAEGIKRFYDDKDFAVKAYLVYDKQSPTDVARFYDIYAKANLFERIPYALAGAVRQVIAQQTDPRLIELMKNYDYRKVIDNSIVDRLVKGGFFERLYGPGIKAEEARKAKLAFR
jgi:ABC-type nitrate/sulfonate/bicarbonate transport system substrate-binding protein